MFLVEYEDDKGWHHAEPGINGRQATYASMVVAKQVYDALLPLHARISTVTYNSAGAESFNIILDSGVGNDQYWVGRHADLLGDIVTAVVRYDSSQDAKQFYDDICLLVEVNRQPHQ